MKKNLAIVLLSGGMDSAVCAAIAKNAGFELAAIHLNYGQLTQLKELECFNLVCQDFSIEHKLVTDVSFLAEIGGSSLTDNKIEVKNSNLGLGEIPNTYVPFRNANILAIATSWAEVIEARAIFIGAMEQDSSGYPDCRKSFFSAFQSTINLGTKPGSEIKIFTPIIDMTKSGIIKIGLELGVDFSHTWSCYKNSDIACGQCESCRLRLRGFRDAGKSDPIKYSAE
ncbi:MAG: 7-cyano-7-deazaguanine synthase QueC [Candidatus Kapabacteria bacterium]|nr:7-cyano-7-deazaguanine synthase QueC [Ignavibacteriota bacterium]MCW5885050.1 7-cyano-7-deazaguanine synthase QueC [Candidatus Kapabacteria bacterium]